MLRPERMSRVSVTGSKGVMTDVIGAVHDMNLLHVTDYDGGWEGFDPGDPLGGAEDAATKLVTVRSLKSILGIDDSEDLGAGSHRVVTEDALSGRLEEIRQTVNDLDDQRDEIESELGTIEERIETMQPFARLGIDLDLLSGYDSLSVAVGEGDRIEIEQALTETVPRYELFGEEGVIGIFASGEQDLSDILVGSEFAAHEIPDAEGSPEEYISELEHKRQRLESKLSTVEDQLEDQRLEHGGFLLAVEETLAIQVQRQEAPLSFATTKNAFVAEGWIPTIEFDDLVEGLYEAAGDHVEVDELERAAYSGDGELMDREQIDQGPPSAPTASTDGGSEQEEVAPDGGSEISMSKSKPPVIQDNPGPVKPFELLTQAVGRPNYSEIDPTVVVFLTLPVFFGFMIGDVGYGAVYTAIGAYLYTQFDKESFKSLGIVTLAAGLFTAGFGVLFGEVFGLHLVTNVLWKPLIGGAPLKKGLYPVNLHWAQAWFIITALVGVVHLNIGYVFEFIEHLELHDVKEAVIESGSWLLALNGCWIFIFSRLAEGPKPEFLFTVFNHGENAAFALGFTGLPAWTGYVGVGMIVLGALLLGIGPTYELIEIHTVFAHPLSYLRISAELLAEVGLAFAVNLLFFGAYQSEGEFHLMVTHGADYVTAHHPHAEIMFGGMLHMSLPFVLLGVIVLIVGNLIVLALGVMSVGIQAIRLEYFEFFSKFYDGSGIPYKPFGYDRQFTSEE